MKHEFSQNPKIQTLLEKSKHITYLDGIQALLEWDQEVLMPINASSGRAKQMSIIAKEAHENVINPKNGELITDLKNEISNNPQNFTDADKGLVRVFERHYEKATKLPTEFVTELTEHTSKSLESWRKARNEQDFSIFQPDLEKTFELHRQKADYYGYENSRYDALLDIFEPGLTSQKVTEIFEPLKQFTIAFLERIQNSETSISNEILQRDFNTAKQFEFCKELAEGIGYNFDSGRLDLSTHPFTTEFGTSNDVRITTRCYLNELNTSLMGTIHEAGHGMYEQNISPTLDSTYLGGGVSLGMHESQSRMWENFVGRSKEFWVHWYPRLVTQFEDVINLNEEEFFVAALNKVQPSYIRVEADEVTYNLHIILRYELEKELIEGTLAVADLPEAWNSKMTQYLGVTPRNDSEGVLQDIHWASGGIGYFPTYTLGNLYAAQFWGVINKEIPDLKNKIMAGDTEVLLAWLMEKLHVHGSVYEPNTLCNMITGEALNPKYLEKYLEGKFGSIYNL